MGCVSDHETVQSRSEVDSIQATVSITPKSNPSGWFVNLDITVHAPPNVDIDIPIYGSTLGSFNVVALGFGGGGASDGSSVTSNMYELEPVGMVWQTIPVIPISFVDKRTSITGVHHVLYTEEMSFVINPLF